MWPAGRHGKYPHIMWMCSCECGKYRAANGGQLKSGNTKSCGCLNADTLRTRWTKHGHAPAGNPSPEYNSWRGARERCVNPNSVSYPFYGAKRRRVPVHQLRAVLGRAWAEANPWTFRGSHRSSRALRGWQRSVGHAQRAVPEPEGESRVLGSSAARRLSHSSWHNEPLVQRRAARTRNSAVKPGVVDTARRDPREDLERLPNFILYDVARNLDAASRLLAIRILCERGSEYVLRPEIAREVAKHGLDQPRPGR